MGEYRPTTMCSISSDWSGLCLNVLAPLAGNLVKLPFDAGAISGLNVYGVPIKRMREVSSRRPPRPAIFQRPHPLDNWVVSQFCEGAKFGVEYLQLPSLVRLCAFHPRLSPQSLQRQSGSSPLQLYHIGPLGCPMARHLSVPHLPSTPRGGSRRYFHHDGLNHVRISARIHPHQLFTSSPAGNA
jgi:hypothetical protein